MEGVISGKSTMPGQTIEFRGHLIDSLTLSKVTDLIQLMGGHYRLNDIRIGTLKKDISSVNMSVFAQDKGKLQELLTTLSYYGAAPSGDANVAAVPCTEDGVLPEEAFSIKLPGRVHYEGQWLDLHAGQYLAIVINPQTREAKIKNADDIRSGELIVNGTQGIEW
ncbi:MAG TPA: hypothetical protein V6C52_05795 [Coleofasciculaceae cyanobacterium]